MQSSRSFFLIIVTSVLILSCAEESGEKFEAEKFLRIYDYNGFSESFSPIDIVQTEDDGFIILANYQKQTDFLKRGIYLLKVDQYGSFVYDRFLDDNYITAIRGLQFIDGKYYFFCMDQASGTVLVELDADLQSPVFTGTSLTYPAAVAYAGSEGFLVLSYDHIKKKTVFSKISRGGSITVSRTFTIADDDSREDILLQHFLGTGKQYPFSIGKFANGSYFFNGFYDYTFSFVVTGLADDDDVNQFIHGQHEDGGLSAIEPLTNNSFAASYFNFGSNYFVTRILLPEDPSSISNLGGYHMRELVPNAQVQIDRVTLKEKPLLVFSTDIKSKQIGLYFYDEGTGNLAGSTYLGFSNPYELGKVIVTEDGGLAICGTTYIAGRFPRICLFKLSKEELENSIQ